MSVFRHVVFYTLLMVSVGQPVFSADNASSKLSPALLYHSSKDEGHGIVHVVGSILDAACAISTESKDQVIELGWQSVQELISQGFGTPKKLVINLEYCNQDNSSGWKNVDVTFLGVIDRHDPRLFAISGDASGAGVQIFDAEMKTIIPGKTFSEGAIPEGSTQLVYYIRLTADSDEINDGTGSATIKFRLSYD